MEKRERRSSNASVTQRPSTPEMSPVPTFKYVPLIEENNAGEKDEGLSSQFKVPSNANMSFSKGRRASRQSFVGSIPGIVIRSEVLNDTGNYHSGGTSIKGERVSDKQFGSTNYLKPHQLLTPGEIEQRQSKVSFLSAGSSGTSKFPNAREINETFYTKLWYMINIFAAILVNSLLLVFFNRINVGLVVPMSDYDATHYSPVFVETVLLIANVITLLAMDDGSAAFFGERLASNTGYSLAVCGFQQASYLTKYSFCNSLSTGSSCAKLLSRISIVWVVMELLKFVSPIAATAMIVSEQRINRGSVSCVEFGEVNVPVDRGWPTFDTEQGIAELIFGTALGSVRSEFPLDYTTAIMSPNIVGAVADGDTIIGPGFTTKIFTTCACSASNDAAGIMAVAPDLTADSAANLLVKFRQITKIGVASYIKTYSDKVVITSLIAGEKNCGGFSNKTFISTCSTTFSDHYAASIMASYMTDGTPASIAINWVKVVETKAAANLSWVAFALNAIHGGQYSGVDLPSTIPGTMNPLLWWTTPNLISMDPSLIESGMETYFTILLRAAMQRTFSAKGNSCMMNVAIKTSSVLNMEEYGIQVALTILIFQLIVSFVACIAFLPWLLRVDPISPSVRVLKETIYFTTLLNASGTIQVFGELCNATTDTIWQVLDVVVRIGEALMTVEDEIGSICMEKPKVVRSMTNGKKYS